MEKIKVNTPKNVTKMLKEKPLNLVVKMFRDGLIDETITLSQMDDDIWYETRTLVRLLNMEIYQIVNEALKDFLVKHEKIILKDMGISDGEIEEVMKKEIL